MLPGLLLILAILLVIGFAVWAIETAPFVSESVKPFIRWAAIVVGGFVVLKLLFDLLGVKL